MQTLLPRPFQYFLSAFLLLLSIQVQSQSCDTISNWEGITRNWLVSTGGSQIVINPHQAGINLSAHCFKVVTSSNQYDLMSCSMPEPANFDSCYKYELKVYPPAGGGKVNLKFENASSTDWQEITLNTVAGQWNRLVFDFSGLPYTNFTRMVIFFDFLGTTPGNTWYFDDILKQIPAPCQLQSKLPIVVINTFGISVPDEPKITAHMGIIDHGAGNLNSFGDPFTNYDGAIGIETRGQSTQMFPQKSYAVETRDSTGANLDVSILGMPAENDWILYAPYTDKSMMRDVVTFDMGRKMGNYCSRTCYCELVLNGDYKGVYVLMEKIKKDLNRVDIATLKPGEITGDDLTGGYILKVDKLDPGFVYDIDGWKSIPSPPYPNAMKITFQYDYPAAADIVSQQRTYIRDYITSAENTLTSAGFADPNTGYHKYLNVASFVDFMLLNEISKEVDKYRYSTFFFKEKNSDGGKLFAGPAWDFNLGYGNVDYWPPGIDYTGWLYTLVATNDASIMFWWKRLMEDSYFRDLARTRWNDFRQDKLSDAHISSVIDSIRVTIYEAQGRDYQRWPILGQYVWPNYNWLNNTYNDEVTYFENFLFNRIHWMDYNLPGKTLTPWLSIAAENGKIRMKVYGDYFSTAVLKTGNFRLNDAPAGMNILGVEYLNAAECLLTVSSDITAFPGISVTVSGKILDTSEDLTSNKLSTAGSDSQTLSAEITVFADHERLHIRCSQPERLPAQTEILNVAGQSLGFYNLSKTTENLLPTRLLPGVYLIRFRIEGKLQVYRVVVL